MRSFVGILLVLAACGGDGSGKDECVGSQFEAWSDLDGDGAGDPATGGLVCELGADQVTNKDDCDDSDPEISPFSPEACDGIDQDCDGTPDDGLVGGTWYADADADGYGDPNTPVKACAQPPNTSTDQTDCDDVHADAHPTAPEVCDGYDNNCDTLADDLDPALDRTTGTTFYRDADGDSYGDDASAQQLCANPNPAQFGELGGDCDDTDPALNPDGSEVCDLLDNNCNTLVDEDDPLLDPTTLSTFYEDLDEDGVGNADALTEACFLGPGVAAVGGDCNDLEPLLQGPGNWQEDGDGDGVGAGPVVGPPACQQPEPGTVPQGPEDDCDDADPTRSPEFEEICGDGIDQDCSGIDQTCGPIGSYWVGAGPPWGGNPPVYSCVEACALIFGGVAGDYHCSTSAAFLDNQAYLSGWGDATYCTTPRPETYQLEQVASPGYNCGFPGCSYSAYVQDNCTNPAQAINYCWPN